VSPLLRDRLLIGLAPAQLSLERRRGFFGARTVEKATLACDPAFGSEPWQGAVAQLGGVKAAQDCSATVVLSNHFVRYALVPWSDALSGPAEEEAYVRHHFARVHGERARSWALRWSESGAGARLASAIDKALLDALKKRLPRLASVQPYLMSAINRWRKSIPRGGAWLALVEPDRACIALHAGGRWRSVQNAKGAWLPLLERERYRVQGGVQGGVQGAGPDAAHGGAGDEVPALALVAGAPPQAAPGWSFRELPGDSLISFLSGEPPSARSA